ncbi:hypothetical protein [Pedobacter paludis]|uniref:Uncharacterized protein n=1 Tax=Pedobacter paludis TaxID=2203212 RepID=A0A317F438_9SPHI|nr:hypothetical protein [Pedobacter paludis]PWS32246.1 hypothetical protein DF947_10790 [Pedobacter paludis]
MKDLQELEQHVSETIIALRDKNWVAIVPPTQRKEAHTRFVEVRKGLLDAIYLCVDGLDAMQWLIDKESDPQPGIHAKSTNPEGIPYGTDQLLKMRLKALYLSAPQSIVDDVVKFIKMFEDEMRQQMAKMMYQKAELIERLKQHEKKGV